jgi:hypothetical protein
MKKLIAATALASSAFLATTSAYAVSCTQQGGECRAWANNQGGQSATYVAKCNAEVPRCIARCKGGNKVFIGVSQGLHYPITDCK